MICPSLSRSQEVASVTEADPRMAELWEWSVVLMLTQDGTFPSPWSSQCPSEQSHKPLPQQPQAKFFLDFINKPFCPKVILVLILPSSPLGCLLNET